VLDAGRGADRYIGAFTRHPGSEFLARLHAFDKPLQLADVLGVGRFIPDVASFDNYLEEDGPWSGRGQYRQSVAGLRSGKAQSVFGRTAPAGESRE
jgi:hypothetical protein